MNLEGLMVKNYTGICGWTVARIFRTIQGLSTEDLLRALGEERERYHREHYDAAG